MRKNEKFSFAFRKLFREIFTKRFFLFAGNPSSDILKGKLSGAGKDKKYRYIFSNFGNSQFQCTMNNLAFIDNQENLNLHFFKIVRGISLFLF